METTPEKIAHGRAMLNTIEKDLSGWPICVEKDAISNLRMAYNAAEVWHQKGWIKDPHPRQVGDRILPRWEWWLHRILVKFKLGQVEE